MREPKSGTMSTKKVILFSISIRMPAFTHKCIKVGGRKSGSVLLSIVNEVRNGGRYAIESELSKTSDVSEVGKVAGVFDIDMVEREMRLQGKGGTSSNKVVEYNSRCCNVVGRVNEWRVTLAEMRFGGRSKIHLLLLTT